MISSRLLIFCLLSLFVFKLSAQSGITEGRDLKEGINYYRAVETATAFYEKKAYSDALKVFEQALSKPEANKNDYYNAACCASLVGDLDKANAYLNKSIELGYWDLKWMSNDADFANFRQDRRWEKAIQKLNTTLNTVEAKFERIKGLPLTALVPYQENELWGYLQQSSREILVKAEFEKVSFAGNCLEIKQKSATYSIGPDAKILLEHNNKSTQYRERQFFQVVNPPTLLVDSSDGFKGFKVNEKGYISVVSKDVDQNNGKPIVSPIKPINIEGKMYAIVRKQGKYGLLDQDGATHPKIGFHYKILSYTTAFKGTEKCFLTKNESDQWGFVLSTGETRFQSEFDTLLRPEEYFKFFNLNLLIVKKGNTQGVIDIPTMTWALKPTENIEILDLGFTHKDNYCNTSVSSDIDQSKILDFYFWVKSINGQSYYIGKDQVSYLPK